MTPYIEQRTRDRTILLLAVTALSVPRLTLCLYDLSISVSTTYTNSSFTRSAPQVNGVGVYNILNVERHWGAAIGGSARATAPAARGRAARSCCIHLHVAQSRGEDNRRMRRWHCLELDAARIASSGRFDHLSRAWSRLMAASWRQRCAANRAISPEVRTQVWPREPTLVGYL